MRAQNEPPETVVRLVRGELDGEPTDVPGAYRVERVDEQALAEGRIWPQSRGSQLAGLSSARARASACSTSAPRPAARRRCSRARSSRSRCNEAARASSRRTSAGSARTNVRVVHADALALPAELTGFDRALVDAPCSGLGVLAARPDLRWRSQPLPELQLELLRAAAERVRPGRHDRLLGLHDQRRRERGGRRRVRPRGRRPARREVAAVPPPAAPGVPADAAARPRHERLLHRAGCVYASRDVRGRRIGLGLGNDWIRDGSRSSRRSTRPTSPASASRSTRCSTRAAGSSTSTSATGTSSRR